MDYNTNEHEALVSDEMNERGRFSYFLPTTCMFDLSHIRTMDDVQKFLDMVSVSGIQEYCPKRERAQLTRTTLVQFAYARLRRRDQGLLGQFLRVVTRYSLSQFSRHINAYRRNKPIHSRKNCYQFPTVFTTGDRELLAETDNLHGRLNGIATKKICAQMLRSGDVRFARLAKISVAHLYSLRQGERYRENAVTIEKTKPVQVPIGERRKPDPNGIPVFIRVDTVHQGDRDGRKGLYHVNMVDEVTQWQVIVAVETISESCLVPAMEEGMRCFPFVIRNFHSDNGSEYINYTVAKLLDKLRIAQTKSRPRHSNDNGLVETKNGAIIRKHMTYHHIPQPFATRTNRFYQLHLVPYLNFHRPCAFPITFKRPDGKVKILYREEDYKTPLEKLLSLPHASRNLRKGVSLKRLWQAATSESSNECARKMQQARRELFSIIVDTPPESFSDDRQ